MRFKLPVIICLLQAGFISSGQPVQQKINQFRIENEKQVIDEYIKFLLIPNMTPGYREHFVKRCFYKNHDETARNKSRIPAWHHA